MSAFYKNVFWAIMTLLMISFLFSFILDQQSKPQKFSLNELAAKINAGEVKKITVEGEEIQVVLQNDAKATSHKELEAGLTETLKNFGVDPAALQKVELAIQSQSGFRFWLGILIPTLLPILAIGFIFWLMFRQARTGVNQAFNFGRSNIRLSVQGKEKATFKDVAGLKEAKEELVEVVDFLKSPKKFLDLGARIPRGVLLVGLPGTGKCVTGDALVATNKGLVEIRDIPKYFWVDPETNRVDGAQLPTVHLETLKDEVCPASHWYDLGEQDTFSVTLRQGMSLEGTPEHPVVVMDEKGRLEFKPLADLKPEDLVAVKFNTQSFGTLREVDIEEAYMMGLLTGDGNLSHASRVGFTTTDAELAETFREYVTTRYPGTPVGLASDTITHLVSSWSMKRDLYRAGMSYLLSYDKIIPPTILMAPREVAVAFLQGLFDTDGYIERYTVGYATVSKKLSDQVMMLLLNLGIVPRRRIKSADATHPRPVYEITISGTSLAEFASRIGFRLKRKQSQLDTYLATHTTGNTNVDIFHNITHMVEACWHDLHAARRSTDATARIIDKVRYRKRISRRSLKILATTYKESGITSAAGEYLVSLLAAQVFFSPVAHIKKGRARVYDFTVPHTQSFISNGFVSHNTLLARATAGESNVPFFHMSASELVEMFVGVGASRVRDSFATAKKAAPAILFIDEIDAVGRQRGAGLGGGNDEREQTLNQILVELDGFDRDTRLIIISATNRPDVLDPALLRPGRFDRRVILDLPDINDREEILKLHAKGKALDPKTDLRKVAVRTPGFSGADLANLTNEAAILAARRNKKTISQDELFEAVEKVLLGPERRSRAISKKEKEITAYHEGGHALVAASLKDADPVHKVSIIARGLAGGYTMKLPLEEQRLRTKTQFLNDLAMLMGGYASEKLTFKDISTGASNDLREATDLARKLVTKYGMSDSLGPQTFGKTEELIFLGREIATEKNYSEKIAAKIDEEVRAFIERAYSVAEGILAKHKSVLKKIAETLIEKETLEQEEFYALLKPLRIKAGQSVTMGGVSRHPRKNRENS